MTKASAFGMMLRLGGEGVMRGFSSGGDLP